MIKNLLSSEARKKRILYRSNHRGCKETDIVLGRFANAELDHLSPEELDQFEALLDEQDWDIWDAVSNPASRALAPYAALLEKIKNSQNILTINAN